MKTIAQLKTINHIYRLVEKSYTKAELKNSGSINGKKFAIYVDDYLSYGWYYNFIEARDQFSRFISNISIER